MIKVGDKVRPAGNDDLGTGTVEEILYDGPMECDLYGLAYVWWPTIQHTGAWPCDKLEKR